LISPKGDLNASHPNHCNTCGHDGQTKQVIAAHYFKYSAIQD
jgi:hypothetical protein